jgi:hypothetical protein
MAREKIPATLYDKETNYSADLTGNFYWREQ